MDKSVLEHFGLLKNNMAQDIYSFSDQVDIAKCYIGHLTSLLASSNARDKEKH